MKQTLYLKTCEQNDIDFIIDLDSCRATEQQRKNIWTSVGLQNSKEKLTCTSVRLQNRKEKLFGLL